MQTQDTLTFELGTVTPDQALSYAQSFITTSGYTDPETMDSNHDTIVAMGLGLLEDCPAWARADHVNAIKARLNRNLSSREMRELARLYKVSAKRLANNATTGKQWTQERRWATDHVGYSHHELLNGLSVEEQDSLMELADANGWSCDELAAHRYGHANTTPTPIPDNGNPQPSIYAGISDEEPPYADNSLYKDYDMLADDLAGDADGYDWTDTEHIIISRNPVDAAAVLRKEFTEADLATLVQELIR